MSQSVNNPGSLSATFADNIGSDVTLVRSGSLTIPQNAFDDVSETSGVVNPFSFWLFFDSPYHYSGGDLLITIRHTGGTVAAPLLDGIFDSVGNYETIAGTGYTATRADIDINTPVTALSYSTPDPGSTLALLALSLGGLLAIRRR